MRPANWWSMPAWRESSREPATLISSSFSSRWGWMKPLRATPSPASSSARRPWATFLWPWISARAVISAPLGSSSGMARAILSSRRAPGKAATRRRRRRPRVPCPRWPQTPPAASTTTARLTMAVPGQTTTCWATSSRPFPQTTSPSSVSTLTQSSGGRRRVSARSWRPPARHQAIPQT